MHTHSTICVQLINNLITLKIIINLFFFLFKYTDNFINCNFVANFSFKHDISHALAYNIEVISLCSFTIVHNDIEL